MKFSKSTKEMEANQHPLEAAAGRLAAGGNARTQSAPAQPAQQPGTPDISVVVLNYNGAAWLDRCLTSLAAQTIADDVEIIFADNASTDHSDLLAADLLKDRPNWRLVRHREDLGCSGGYNEAARLARGQYLMFLNEDVWLEPDCLERLLNEVRATGATVATALVMNYQDDTVQSAGESGFDLFGFVCGRVNWSKPQEILVANGPTIIIETNWFRKLGGFDARFFMYAEEYDLCWRTWLAGGRVMLAPSARAHHRSAVAVNASAGPGMFESRTSDTKRFYANRNGLLVLLKNSQHLLLLFVPLQLGLLAVEALAMSVMVRRWSFIRRAYLDALWDCWRLRRHILAERRQIRGFRRRSDFWMLRFLQPRLNRWRELRRFLRFGLPKVDHK
jgi:GT2 family glycosyltransferase